MNPLAVSKAIGGPLSHRHVLQQTQAQKEVHLPIKHTAVLKERDQTLIDLGESLGPKGSAILKVKTILMTNTVLRNRPVGTSLTRNVPSL